MIASVELGPSLHVGLLALHPQLLSDLEERRAGVVRGCGKGIYSLSATIRFGTTLLLTAFLARRASVLAQ